MLLDEPSLGLSPAIVQSIAQQIKQFAADDGVSVVLVEQNVRAALRIADRAYFMRSGEIILEQDSATALARGNWWDLFRVCSIRLHQGNGRRVPLHGDDPDRCLDGAGLRAHSAPRSVIYSTDPGSLPRPAGSLNDDERAGADRGIYLEVGRKKVLSGALDWPGLVPERWRRRGSADAEQRTHRAAYDLLADGDRTCPPDDPAALAVVERLAGTSDRFRGTGCRARARQRAIDEAARPGLRGDPGGVWRAFDRAVKAAEGRNCRKGPAAVAMAATASCGTSWEPTRRICAASRRSSAGTTGRSWATSCGGRGAIRAALAAGCAGRFRPRGRAAYHLDTALLRAAHRLAHRRPLGDRGSYRPGGGSRFLGHSSRPEYRRRGDYPVTTSTAMPDAHLIAAAGA